jgi:hypothetical protein
MPLANITGQTTNNPSGVFPRGYNAFNRFVPELIGQWCLYGPQVIGIYKNTRLLMCLYVEILEVVAK